MLLSVVMFSCANMYYKYAQSNSYRVLNFIYWLVWEYWSNTDMELQNAEETMGIRKILALDIRMKKNSQTKEDTLWIFKYFYGFMRVQSST